MNLIVEADGGSRGNPGIAGAGALVREGGRVIDAIAIPLGKKTTNNVAEYEGLIAGLEIAQSIDPSATVQVRLDSNLVVNQVFGTWQAKNPSMRRLCEQAKEIVAEFEAEGGSVTGEWIPRKKNKDADELSNEAMDAESANSLWSREDSALCNRHDISSGTARPEEGEEDAEWDLEDLEIDELEDLALAVAQELKSRR